MLKLQLGFDHIRGLGERRRCLHESARFIECQLSLVLRAGGENTGAAGHLLMTARVQEAQCRAERGLTGATRDLNKDGAHLAVAISVGRAVDTPKDAFPERRKLE